MWCERYGAQTRRVRLRIMGKRILALVAVFLFWLSAAACTETEITDAAPPAAETTTAARQTEEAQTEEMEMKNLQITVNGSSFTVELYDTEAARALLEKLPMTVTMHELNGNEKYYYMNESLPVASQRVGQIRTGDLLLYGSDCLVLFYESFQTPYSYTPLGRVENTEGLAAALGTGDAEVTFTPQ